MRRDLTNRKSIVLAAFFGALLIALAYQIPVIHRVDIGGLDAAYTSGFFESERISAPNARAYLDGSDGAARWTHAESFLLFPQAGLPAQLKLRMRGHPDASPIAATILVNGNQVAQFTLGQEWVEQTIVITGGLTKPEDVLVTLRTTPRPLGGGDSRQVGLLLDQVTLTVGPFPILPYPLQVMYAALAGGLLAILVIGLANSSTLQKRVADNVQRRAIAYWLLAMPALAIAFLCFYRMQPLYPWPLRGMLLSVVLVLAALVSVQYAEHVLRPHVLPDMLAIMGIVAWVAAILLVGQDHLVLSVPGVEKDFRVFATRDTPATIFSADGFYNLGYPLLLWLARPLAQDNPFLAARLISALAAGMLLLATWWLARRWLGARWALVALTTLAFSPFVVQYGLYLGSDMPFAALCAWALVGLDAGMQGWGATKQGDQETGEQDEHVVVSGDTSGYLVAGIMAGLAFLVRHPGLMLLPLGWLVVMLQALRARVWLSARGYRLAAIFTVAFVLTISLQLVVNIHDTGQALYSQQAKNIWLAVFGGGDWGRWGEASNDVALAEVIAQDPGRFWENVSGNLRAFVGSGAEDTSEFGRAIQLRLLGFPANWLATIGLLAWLWNLIRIMQTPQSTVSYPLVPLLWVLLYVPAIAIGFALPRFFLPLAAIYALAAAWALRWACQQIGDVRVQFGLGLLLLALLWGGFNTGATYVVRPVIVGSDIPGQPETSLGVARLVLTITQPTDRVLIRIPPDDETGLALAKYSAISQRVVAPVGDTVEALQASGATLLVWSDQLGPAPEVGRLVGKIGVYSVWQLK